MRPNTDIDQVETRDDPRDRRAAMAKDRAGLIAVERHEPIRSWLERTPSLRCVHDGCPADGEYFLACPEPPAIGWVDVELTRWEGVYCARHAGLGARSQGATGLRLVVFPGCPDRVVSQATERQAEIEQHELARLQVERGLHLRYVRSLTYGNFYLDGQPLAYRRGPDESYEDLFDRVIAGLILPHREVTSGDWSRGLWSIWHEDYWGEPMADGLLERLQATHPAVHRRIAGKVAG